jgi:predicted RNase H-like HicB family nuclease
MRRRYPAFVHKTLESDFGVSFPDFPGCVTAGSTFEEAFEQAIEALQLHIEGFIEDQESIPAPSNLDEAYQTAQEEGAVLTLIPVLLPGRVKRVDITLAENLLEEIDLIRGRWGMTRSGFLAEAARRVIDPASPGMQT